LTHSFLTAGRRAGGITGFDIQFRAQQGALMNALSTTPSRRRDSAAVRRHADAGPQIEPLERRALMSAAWTTTDTDPGAFYTFDMAADKAGNVYSVGSGIGDVPDVREKTPTSPWTTILTANAPFGQVDYSAITTDPAGNVFLAGSTYDSQGHHSMIWERPVGQSGFSVIDSSDTSVFAGIATDSAGDVYVTGTQNVTTSTTVRNKTTTTTTSYRMVRKLTPSNGSFVPSIAYQSTSIFFPGDYAKNITVIDSGASAGVYVVGWTGTNDQTSWQVLKSSDGGGHWTLVDQFQYESGKRSSPSIVTGDGAGNVYVAGSGVQAVLTGYSHGKPIYTDVVHWIVRKSAVGNLNSWSTSDDFTGGTPTTMGADLAGNVYVVGHSGKDAIIRTNAGGSWSTCDDYAGSDGLYAEELAFTVDSNGNLYAGGDDDYGTFVRSMPGPAPASGSTSSPNTSFSSTLITSSSVLNSSAPENDLKSRLESSDLWAAARPSARR
jgi:hypothetical protein